MSDIEDELRRSRLFEGIDKTELARAARLATSVEFSGGAVVCTHGEAATRVGILASGRMRATIGSGDNPERVVGHLEPGDSFGETAILEGGGYNFTITAVQHCRLLTLSVPDFLRLFSEVPAIGRNVIRSLADRLRQTLGMDRSASGGRTIGIVHSGARGRRLLRDLVDEVGRCGERTCCVEGADPAALEQAGAAMTGHDRVFLEFRRSALPNDLPGRLHRCEPLLWFVEPDDEPAMRELMVRAAVDDPTLPGRSRLVWMMPGSRQVAPVRDRAWRTAGRDFLVEMIDPPGGESRRQRQGVRRLARHIRGFTLGLALAGGGARGMAHLGVFRAFERAGIDFDIMSGTSAGALVGITYAAGYAPDWAVETFTRELTTPAWARRLPAGRNWHLLGRFRSGAWDPMLRKYFFDWRLEQLPTPFHSVTCDLVTGREVVRSSGDAADAIQESMNLPVISSPICRDGMTLVDGAVLNNLPADVLTRQGADFVVAVDISSKLRQEFAGNSPSTPTDRMKSPGFMETVLRVLETQSHAVGAHRLRTVDAMVEPDVSLFDFADFSRAAELADVGEAAAESILPKLRQLLAEKEAIVTRTMRSSR